MENSFSSGDQPHGYRLETQRVIMNVCDFDQASWLALPFLGGLPVTMYLIIPITAKVMMLVMLKIIPISP